jgi:hypothetical protein
MSLLETFGLGQYRARCAEEDIDLRALGLCAHETHADLARDLGVAAQDADAFRQVAETALSVV